MLKRIVFSFTIISLILFSGCSFIEPNPDKAVREGMQKLAASKKSQTEIIVSGKGQSDAGLTAFSARLQGKTNSEDKNDIKMDAKFSLQITTKEGIGDIEMDFRALTKKTYIRLSKLSIPKLAIPAEAVSQFLDKWWELPQMPETQSFMDEQQKFLEKIKDIQIFTNVQKVGEEEIKGIASRKYQVELDREGVRKLIIEMAKASKTEVAESESSLIAERLKDIDFSGNVWVGKSDKTAHQLAGTLRIASKENSNVVSIDLNAAIWDIGKDFSVEKPEGANPFNPALLFGLMQSLTSPSSEAPEAKPGIPQTKP